MVESIYGGGKVFPHYHERSLLQRRFSTGTNPLHPISEVNGDELSESGKRTLLFVESTAAQHMPQRTNRPRAYSLPAIYRDGSYLRIELPDETRSGVPPNRRFSEPQVASSATRGRTAFLSEISGNETLSHSASSSYAAGLEVPFEEITHEYVGMRRRSDPYIIGQARKQRLAVAEAVKIGSSGSASDLMNAVKTDSCAENWCSQNKSAAKSELACSRRKFSLPPVPLNVVVHRAKCGTASTRQRCHSYPPSKPEQALHLQKLPGIVSSSGRKASCTSNKTAFCSGDEYENELTSLYAEETEPYIDRGSVEILTRWMKFFG